MGNLCDPKTILKTLSLEEKIELLHGGFLSGGISRLGIPRLLCADGPLGIRVDNGMIDDSPTNDEVEANTALQSDVMPTALPCTLGLAATFDINAAREYGALLGRESLYFGIHVLFGPGLNVMRDPRCGRNYEYFGEDPILTGVLGCATIAGLQELGVAACAKHYYANDEEPIRHYTSSNLDPVTAHELYLRPFFMACREAHVWSIMTGNNLVEGIHVSENREALSLLREEAEWDGVVLTDWRGAYDPDRAATAGLDMTTGFCSYVYGDGQLRDLVKTGRFPESLIDEKALNVLTLYQRTGLLSSGARTDSGAVATPEHKECARRLAAGGTVLLKNDGRLLPIDPTITRSLVVTGPGAQRVLAGTGSSNVYNGHEDVHSVSLLDGLKQAYPEATVVFAEDVADATTSMTEEADAVIYCACTDAPGEGKDMGTIRLPEIQEEAIREWGKVTSRLVVMVQCGSSVDMEPWLDSASSILVVWLGGCMLGAALGDVMTGKVSPSGKLPCTFGKRIQDYPCEALGLWPARLILDRPPPAPGKSKEDRQPLHAYDADYREGLLIGYRWFDKHEIEPRFPFGHGLSYTTFELGQPRIVVDERGLMVTCSVTNTGSRTGNEVVQVYISVPDASADRPVRELKGFGRAEVEPGQTREVMIDIPFSRLEIYDPDRRQWVLNPGTYEVHIGTSSRELSFHETATVKSRWCSDRRAPRS